MKAKDLTAFKLEHKDLLRELEKATRAGGKTGKAAREALEALRPNYRREEKYVLPLLKFLLALSDGKLTPEMAKALPLADKLKAEIPKMLEEHAGIRRALAKLIAAAQAEKQPGYVRLAERLLLHVRMEDEFFYTAAVCTGELLRSKLKNASDGKKREVEKS